MKAIVVLVVLAAAATTAEEGATVVQTDKGRVEGLVEETLKGRPFFSFYGIPFARPPVGEFRFKDPEPSTSWMRIWRATKMPQPCLQVPFMVLASGGQRTPENMLGSENCLFLNVFTPSAKQLPRAESLPVMVWLHGGGYYAGAANEYLPHVLLDQDIVLVVVQYRLGVLGFLSTEDSAIPGNFGLKDQTMALRWVHNNIHNFGGDKTRVTIFGESAGGAAGHFQMLAPSAKGLFSRVIMQSGTAVASWGICSSSTLKEAVEVVRQAAGCPPHQDSLDLLACLQKADARELAGALPDLLKWYVLPINPCPRVDGDYLPDRPVKMVREGRYHQVDLMVGVTKHEGALWTKPMFARPPLIAALVTNFSSIGAVSLTYDEEQDSLSVARRVYEHYLGGLNIDEDHVDELTQMYSDVFFDYPSDIVTQYHASHAQDTDAMTYRYRFDHKGELSIGDLFDTHIGKHYVCHADDLFYLFAGGPLLQPIPEFKVSKPEDLHMRDLLTKLWTNFAATGNPTPDASLGFRWKAVKPDHHHYLAINTSPTMSPDTGHQMREFHGSLATELSAGLPDLATHLHQEQSRPGDEL